MSDLRVAFREYRRVLKPGGIVLVLEISRPRSAALLMVSRFYIKTVMGVAFATATGNQDMRTLMRYWWDTTERCVAPETILSALGDVGFAECGLREQFSGLLRNYRAVKARQILQPSAAPGLGDGLDAIVPRGDPDTRRLTVSANATTIDPNPDLVVGEGDRPGWNQPDRSNLPGVRVQRALLTTAGTGRGPRSRPASSRRARISV